MGGKANDIVIMRTCDAIAKLGYPVKMITGKPAKEKSISEYYGIRQVREFEIIRVPMMRGRPFSWNAVFNLFCLLKILSLKRRGEAGIIYLREIKLARFLLRFKRILGLPFVIEVHDLKIKAFYDSCPERDKDEEYVFHKVNGIVVLLRTFGEILKNTYHISGTPVTKVPLAAERTRFNYKPSGRKIIGYIGQLYPMQGVDLLVEAMRYLTDARLSIVGGSERDLRRLKKLSADLRVENRIDFHGFVSPHRVTEIAKDADVMVISALDRGKRRYAAHTKLYEYMAMGKPIVAVDLPSVREEMIHGKNALLVKPEDPQELAEKIGIILNDHEKANALALKAYETAGEFSWEKRAARLAEFFRKVCADYQGKE
jgi:glycosyltransferase involved in cell wall biosynthesis